MVGLGKRQLANYIRIRKSRCDTRWLWRLSL